MVDSSLAIERKKKRAQKKESDSISVSYQWMTCLLLGHLRNSVSIYWAPATTS